MPQNKPNRYSREREKERYRINHHIRVREVRVVDQDGNQLGVLPTEQARRLAQEAGLDLVEVAPNAQPPVCRILDFGKFKYQQKKKQTRAKNAAAVLKEIRVRPKIDPHDLEIKARKARDFLDHGHKVQVTCLFRGRELAYKELGREVLNRFVGILGETAKVEREPRLEGRRMHLLLTRHERGGTVPAAPVVKSAPAAPDGGVAAAERE